MDNFLENRESKLITGVMSAASLNRMQSAMQYKGMLAKIDSMSEEIVSQSTFLDTEIDTVILAAEAAVQTLENKVENIRDTNRTLNKAKLEVSSIARSSDISIVNMNKGTFVNMAFSITDKGIILDSEDKVSMGEEK